MQQLESDWLRGRRIWTGPLKNRAGSSGFPFWTTPYWYEWSEVDMQHFNTTGPTLAILDQTSGLCPQLRDCLLWSFALTAFVGGSATSLESVICNVFGLAIKAAQSVSYSFTALYGLLCWRAYDLDKTLDIAWWACEQAHKKYNLQYSIPRTISRA